MSKFDPDNYNNPADTYKEPIEVKYGSSISPQTFDISLSYITEVVYISSALGVAGLVALLGFIFGLCLRYFFTCCECRPRPVKFDPLTNAYVVLDGEDGQILEEDSQYDDEHEDDDYDYNHVRNYDLYQTYPWNRNRWITFICLLLFASAALCFDQWFLVGRVHVTKGLDTIEDNFDAFSDIVHSVQNDSDILVDYGADLTSEYNQAKETCPEITLSDFYSYLKDYNSSVQSLQEYVAPLSDNIDKADDYFPYYAKGAFLFLFWGFFLSVLLLIILFALFEKRWGLQVMTGIGILLEIFFILIGVILMFLVMILGDLCTKPTYNVLDSLSNSDNIQSIANYYATCQGNTTIQTDLHQANKYIDQLYDALQDLEDSGYCPGNAEIQLMEATVVSVNNTVNHLIDTTDCPNIQTIWFGFVNDGLCSQLYVGIFDVWGAQILTCLFLFVTLLIVTIYYQYFPKHPWVKDRLYQNNIDPGAVRRVRSGSNSTDSYYQIEVGGRPSEGGQRNTNDIDDEIREDNKGEDDEDDNEGSEEDDDNRV